MKDGASGLNILDIVVTSCVNILLTGNGIVLANVQECFCNDVLE